MKKPIAKPVNRGSATRRQSLDFVRHLSPVLCVHTDRGIVDAGTLDENDVPLCDPRVVPVVVLRTTYRDILRYATWYECYRSDGRGYTYIWENAGRVRHEHLMLASDDSENVFIMYNLLDGPALPLGQLDPSDHFTKLVLTQMGLKHVRT